MLGKGVINKVRQLEGVGMSMQKNAAKKIHPLVLKSGKAGQMTLQGKALNQAGRGVSAMGRNPGKTLAGGALGGAMMMSAVNRPTSGNMRGMDLGNQLRQDTRYNQRMRSGQSSALSGLQPRSMGGYA